MNRFICAAIALAIAPVTASAEEPPQDGATPAPTCPYAQDMPMQGNHPMMQDGAMPESMPHSGQMGAMQGQAMQHHGDGSMGPDMHHGDGTMAGHMMQHGDHQSMMQGQCPAMAPQEQGQ